MRFQGLLFCNFLKLCLDQQAGLFQRFLDPGNHICFGLRTNPFGRNGAIRRNDERVGNRTDRISGKCAAVLIPCRGVIAAEFGKGAGNIRGTLRCDSKHDDFAGVFAVFFIYGLDVPQLALARVAPGSPEVQEYHFALVIGKPVRYAVLIL